MSLTIGELLDKAIRKEGNKLVLYGNLPFSKIQPISASMTLCTSDSDCVLNINGNMAKQIIYGLMQEAFELGKETATLPANAGGGEADPTEKLADLISKEYGKGPHRDWYWLVGTLKDWMPARPATGEQGEGS